MEIDPGRPSFDLHGSQKQALAKLAKVDPGRDAQCVSSARWAAELLTRIGSASSYSSFASRNGIHYDSSQTDGVA